MAMQGYFIQVTFDDGTEVSAYAAYDGTWYYFYTDRRFRFTLTSTGAVEIQQYQPIGSNMAWYDINIITGVNVEQFDPDNAGGGTGPVPEDVYTKKEVDQIVADAVQQVLETIADIYVKKSGDTMTGSLRVQNAAGQYSLIAATECTVFGENNNVFMNPKTGFGVTTSKGQYKGRLDENGWYRCNPPGNSGQAVTVSYNGLTVTYGGNYRLVLSSSATNSYVATYSSDGTNSRFTPSTASWYTNGGTSASTLTAGTDAISFNKTIQVPASGSFLVSGMCRYGGNLINRYGSTINWQFNDETRITFDDYGTYTGITVLKEGRVHCRRGTGISASEDSTFGYNGMWLCGPIYHYGNSANENAKYYSYSGTGASFQLMGVLDASTTQSGGLQLSGYNGLRVNSNAQLNIYGGNGNQIEMNDGNTYLRLGTSGSTSIVGRLFIQDYFTRQYASDLLANQVVLGAYISAMLSTSGDPSTTNINIISLGLVDAINTVINAIQDQIGTNFSASYSSGFLAGGGQSRGGGIGRRH